MEYVMEVFFGTGTMCGRTACTLGGHVIQSACTYVDPQTKSHTKPEWKEHPNPKSACDDVPRYQYYPSANLAPTQFTPILFSENKKQVLQPMMWGMIPPWHKGEAKSHGMSTNNCRLEGITESKLFKRPLSHRKLCVVIAQGFYEWKTIAENKKTPKQPYYIFMSQDKKFSPDDVANDETWMGPTSSWSEAEGWTGPKILMMAGVYDIWKNADGDPIYSYSIITMESNETLSWLHHRMPAILETPEEVHAWLNPSPDASIQEIVSILKPASALDWYTVSTKVNNSRCHDLDCAKRIDITEKKPNTFMDNWLKRTPKVKAEEASSDGSEVTTKKPKIEKL